MDTQLHALEGAADVAAAALAEFAGQDVDVALLDADGQPQLVVYGRVERAVLADDDCERVALELAEVGGGRHVGGLTLTGDASATWRDEIMRRVTATCPDPVPIRGLVIDLGDGREVALCAL